MPRRNIKKLGPDPLDARVGERIRDLRLQKGASQSDLAEAVGLTFQQIQKYERAKNRVSASALYKIAKFFSVPVGSFYDEPVTKAKQDRMLMELVKDWQKLPRGQRGAVRDMVRVLAHG